MKEMRFTLEKQLEEVSKEVNALKVKLRAK
jgi:hypothetical protein